MLPNLTHSTTGARELSRYAAFLLREKLDEATQLNLLQARVVNLPLLRFFAHLDEEALVALTRESLKNYFMQLQEGVLLIEADRAITGWKADKLPGIPREQIEPADIVLNYSLRKRLLIELLPTFSTDVTVCVAVALELEQLYAQLQQNAFQAYVDIQHETFKSYQEELQAANEELAEQREEIAAANEELCSANEELSAQREELATANEELHEHLTQLEESQQALSESEARLLEAQSISHLGHWSYEGDSKRVYWSEEMKRIFGREPVAEELTGEGYLALVHSEDRPAIREQLFGSVRNGGPFTLEHRLLRPDGTIRWIFVQGDTRVSAGRTVARVSGTSLDITERKEAELALQAEKYFIEKLTDASPDVITLYDLEQMRNLYSSREVYSILGYSEEELRQINSRGPEAFVEYFHPEDLSRVVSFLEEYKSYRGEAPRETEYRIKSAAGEWVYILDRYRVFKRNSEGLPVQIMGVARNITERKRAEREIEQKNRQLQKAYEEMSAAREELHQANEKLSRMNFLLEERVEARTLELAVSAARLQLITDSLPVLISYVDNQQRYQFNNKTYEDWFGLPRHQVYGKTVAEVLGPQAYVKLESQINRVLAGEPVDFLTELPYQFGNTRLVSALYVPHWQDNQVKGYYALISDVTQQQKTHQALQQALEETQQKNGQLELLNARLDRTNQELDRSNKDLDTFVYTASHDLRAPIANMTGLLRVLTRRLAGKTSHEEQEMLELMNQAVERLSRTINVLTQVVKVQKEQQPAEVLDFLQTIEEVKFDLGALLETAQPQIRLQISVGEISFPRQYLRSIVYNLLSNALKYRSPERSLLIKVSTFREGGFIVFCVEDNGLGIAPTQTDKVFQMFKRLHTHVEGTGVGLYMVRQMVENHGGRSKWKASLTRELCLRFISETTP
jgi:PAS domain S-box-containing protein